MALSTTKLVLAVVAVLAATCGVAFGLSEALRNEETRTERISRHIERVVVKADAGDVRLEPAPGGRVEVRESLRWLVRKPRVTAIVRGALLEVRASCPGSSPANRCVADLTVRVPFDADVAVEGDAGDIVAEALAGKIELSTDAGDIEGRRLNPVSARVATDAGDVNLDFATPPVSVGAASDAGDVAVTLPGGEYRVDAVTDAGDVEVEGILRDDRAMRSITAQTDAGDVSVRGRAAPTGASTPPRPGLESRS